MKTIKVLGQSDDTLKNVEFGEGLENFSVSDTVRFATDRAVSSYKEIKDLENDDVVELIFEDDIHRWVTVAELEEQFKYQISRGEEPGVIEIPDRLPSGDPSRGATAWVLKGLRVLKFDPVEKTVGGVVKNFDANKLMPNPGLFRFDGKLDKRGETLDNPSVAASKPILLFIHGTFSSIENGFGSLHPEVWAKLQEKYGNQIFGFNHRTLSESPIQNTLELVEKLPRKAILHLVTHSRGGLIGELLCRSGRTGGPALFDSDDENLMLEDQANLTKLSGLLKEKEIKVERFVRVACPARGTTLASKRVDRWLEIILNVIAKVLPPGPSNIFGVLADLLLELKKQSSNPEAIPGLAAMDPESNFIKMINREDVRIEADLTVIAGDVEKNNLVGRLGIFFTDLFYTDEHDLVVQTPAMYGGPSRQVGRYFFDRGADVNHFNYFSNEKTARKIEEALLSEGDDLGAQGFRPIQEAYVRAVPDVEITARSYQKRSSVPQPVVYILPGIMGTHLADGNDRIWVHLLHLALGKMANLQIANKNVRPEALVAFAYADLVEYLSSTHEVIPFPYDWRLSILDEAKRLAGEIENKLEATDQPIRIIAHSMGGLVTRAMLGSRPDLWKKMCERDGARFVMLGTPNRGSYQIPRLILGQEKTLRMLAAVDIKNSVRELLGLISGFPGVLGLLPMETEPWNFTEASTWDKFPNTGGDQWVKPTQKNLDIVKELHVLLSTQEGMLGAGDPILYVAGYARGAPVAADIDNMQSVIFQGTNQGDGTVPWVSGILPGLKEGRTYYLNASHGDLANTKESFPAIYDLLAKGTTERLPQKPPKVDRGVEEKYILRDDGIEIYPTQADLESTMLGAAPVKYEAPPGKPVRVSVYHGNLSFCSDPVAVGHYEGDGLYSAEKALNHHLNGRLNARHALGQYPGPEGTVEVILNDKGEKPGGAIIVGLGKAGELSPYKLTQTMAKALQDYGFKAVESDRVGKDGEISISTLLIGTGGMGLSVTNSVDAILNGVLQANRNFTLLADTMPEREHLDYNVRIGEVRFIELFLDQAILATRALEPFIDKAEFAVEPLLQTLRGGWKRIAYEEPPGWWNRIYIRASEKDDDTLIFSVPTDRARAEESRLGVQRNNVDSLIAQSVRNPNWDEKLATAMFELMIPNHLKGTFKDLNNVLFVVDEQAARYPWELLYDRRMGKDLPIVVQVGMIRQFSTGTFRENVVDVKNKNVLVVGNPADTPKGFADLPGAEQEASLVASKFRDNGYEVQESIHRGSGSIMIDLFSKDYRVLHLAGHGVYKYPYQASADEKPKVVTGMVLGNGVFLTANEIRNKMNIPELVFINCCHLGVLSDAEKEAEDDTGRNEFNKLAASLSRELIEMGVKAVVAAGWAVDDAAAVSFAETFYNHLLRGYSFGDAIKAARSKTYEEHKDRTNTWAAYQCYGDPAYRLVVQTEGGGRWKERFVDIEEVIVKIEQTYEKATTASALGIQALKDDLDNLVNHIQEEHPGWLADPRLLEAFGKAFAEVFMFAEAVRYYDESIKHKKSIASIKAIEQSANLHIRLAVQRFEQDPAQYNDSKQDIEAHIGTLTNLMETLDKTPERLSMVGSGYKRLAQIASSKPSNVCNEALEQMEKYYLQAWELTKERARDKNRMDPYPLNNALVAHVARLVRVGDKKTAEEEYGGLKKQKDEALRLAVAMQAAQSESFWAAVGLADIELLEGLIDYLSPMRERLSDKLYEKLVEAYHTAWKQYGSSRELNSIIEHYWFLVAVLKEFDPDDDLCAVLENIYAALRKMVEED